MDADDDANAAAKCNSYGDACYDAYEAVHDYDAEGCSYDDAYGDAYAYQRSFMTGMTIGGT